MQVRWFASAALVLSTMPGSIHAGTVYDFTFDENGGGTIIINGDAAHPLNVTGKLAPDTFPTSRGDMVLTYTLPNSIRFSGNGPNIVGVYDDPDTKEIVEGLSFDLFAADSTSPDQMVFYSDLDDGDHGQPDLADTGLPPGFATFNPFMLTLAEVGPEGSNGFSYTVLPFLEDTDTWHFHAISDSPEPSALTLVATGVALLIVRNRRRVMLSQPPRCERSGT
jgi:hypothetical protein